MSERIKRVCVFCGSREGAKPVYAEQAHALGTLMVERGMGLVYGGGSIGLMGTIANAVLAAGGHVTGVIPEALAHREIVHHEAQEVLVVDTMHTRKAKMAEFSDAFIAMPGGLGTFEELFEVLTWAQLGIHAKPIGLLNVDGYFDALLQLIEHAIQEGFVHKQYRHLLVMADTPAALLALLAAYEGPESVLKLMNLSQV